MSVVGAARLREHRQGVVQAQQVLLVVQAQQVLLVPYVFCLGKVQCLVFMQHAKDCRKVALPFIHRRARVNGRPPPQQTSGNLAKL